MRLLQRRVTIILQHLTCNYIPNMPFRNLNKKKPCIRMDMKAMPNIISMMVKRTLIHNASLTPVGALQCGHISDFSLPITPLHFLHFIRVLAQ